jgi:uncharacterized protein
VKLIAEEPESALVRRLVAGWPASVSSVLTRIEVERVLQRSRPPSGFHERLQSVLSDIDFLAIDGEVVAAACRLEPPLLRSLDAIHLATALSVGDDLGALLTFDLRLAAAARAAGVQVLGAGS